MACPGCGVQDIDGLCVDCERVRQGTDPMRRSAAWALAALARLDRHPGLAPFVLIDDGTSVTCEKVSGDALVLVADAHDLVRRREPLLAFAYLARGYVRTRDFSFDPAFASRPGAAAADVVVCGVAGHPLALVVGRPDGESRPTFFTNVPSWLGKGERRPMPAAASPLTVGIRLKSGDPDAL